MSEKKINVFRDLKQSLDEALRFERREKVNLRVSTLPPPPKLLRPKEIRRIRRKLHASQAVFASFLCVSIKAVQSWEQGIRRPRSTALRLLHIAKKNPAVLLSR
jgi:putative transcriptional regulator